MIEAVTLDNTERLLANSPYFAGLPSHSILHLVTNALDMDCANYMLYNPALNIFHAYNAADVTTPGMICVAPDNFLTGSAPVVTQETTTNIMGLALDPDGSGRVWGYRDDSLGQYGLWLRSAAVSGTWTKVLGATNGDAQGIYLTTSGVLWYNDATAGNWAQLRNGVVVATQTTAPIGLYVSQTVPFPDSLLTASSTFSNGISPFGSGAGQRVNAFASAPVFAVTGANMSNADSLVIWNNASISPTFVNNAICRLPAEIMFYSRPPSQVSSGTTNTALLNVGSSYTLAISQYTKGANDVVDSLESGGTYARFSGSESPFKTYNRVALALINRTTKAVKYIGYFDLPTFMQATVGVTANEAPQALVCRGARLVNGELDLISTGYLGTYSATVNANGMLMTKIPLLKLDF